jgi:hypothetical protein
MSSSPPAGQILTVSKGPPNIKQQRMEAVARKQAQIRAHLEKLPLIDPNSDLAKEMMDMRDEEPDDIMEGKENLGRISVPPNTKDPITREPIETGNTIVQIRQINGMGQLITTFIKLENWLEFIKDCKEDNRINVNPDVTMNQPDSAGEDDIFTAEIAGGNGGSGSNVSNQLITMSLNNSMNGGRRRTYRVKRRKASRRRTRRSYKINTRN